MSPRGRMVFWVLLLLGGALLGVGLDLRLFPGLLKNPVWHLASFLLGLWLLGRVRRAAAVTGRTLARYGREGELPAPRPSAWCEKVP